MKKQKQSIFTSVGGSVKLAIVSVWLLAAPLFFALPAKTYAADYAPRYAVVDNSKKDGKEVCGEGDSQVTLSFNIGCKGKGNPIMDALFAIIRVLSIGVGLVIIASIVWAGIQYTSSRGDPQAVGNAIARIRSTALALLIYIFAFAILNWLVPGQLLR